MTVMTPALAVLGANGSGSLQTSAGLRKAAILLIQLGQERASAVLRHMSDGEVEAITGEISRLEAISSAETDEVLGEFHQLMVARAHIAQGGFSFAQQLLQNSIGEERAAEIMDRLHAAAVQMPFQFLHRADPAQLR